MNKVILIGRIGHNPKLFDTQTGTKIAILYLATNESFTCQDGSRIQKTEWHRVVTFGKQAEFCANYLSRGRLVLVEGSLQAKKWDQEYLDSHPIEIKAQRIQVLDQNAQKTNLDYQSQREKLSDNESPEKANRFKMGDNLWDAPF